MAFNRPSEAGVYAVVYIGGTEIKMLLDTGATVTLLSERVQQSEIRAFATAACLSVLTIHFHLPFMSPEFSVFKAAKQQLIDMIDYFCTNA